MTARLSVVVCTFNPDPALLRSCLAAVGSAQSESRFDIEVVLVDNNSDPPLASLDLVAGFMRSGAGRRLIVEQRQGLTHARLAGLAATTAPALVFVDDDNILSPDYFSSAATLLERHSDVGVWGPGAIDVEWGDAASRWIRGYAACFQERRAPTTRFGSVAGWPEFYPTGTGMVVRREVLTEYAAQLAAGRIDAIGRKGTQLTSGEDNQIVWTAVRMGMAAGVSPDLRLTHRVERRKARVGYILRMVFATMASGRIAARQSFPERPDLWMPPASSRAQWSIIALAVKELALLRLRSGPMQVIRHMGDLHGQFLAARQTPPWLTRIAAKALGFSWAP
jgi:glycosyltransferase involved in cell wall biosynthesis